MTRSRHSSGIMHLQYFSYNDNFYLPYPLSFITISCNVVLYRYAYRQPSRHRVIFSSKAEERPCHVSYSSYSIELILIPTYRNEQSHHRDPVTHNHHQTLLATNKSLHSKLTLDESIDWSVVTKTFLESSKVLCLTLSNQSVVGNLERLKSISRVMISHKVSEII